MTHRTAWMPVVVVLLVARLCAGQATPAAVRPQPPAATPPPSYVAPTDPALDAAEDLVGRALFLRGFYTSDNLTYDAAGKLQGASDACDWTLAAVNILKATRPSPDAIELDGVRVAIRYNPDAHEFQRHPMNDEKMKLLIQLAPGGDAGPRPLAKAFAAMFSIGIDPALQRSMPPLWRHYFDPSVPWPADPLSSQTIYPMPPLPALAGPPVEIVPPILTHQIPTKYTPPGTHDKVQGTVQLRIVVDEQGVPRRIAVTRPLGYGLDQQAADAVAQWRFNPALHAGQSVPSAILVNIDFQLPPPQR